MEKTRLQEIVGSTGMSVDEVVDIQFDDNQFPGKPVMGKALDREFRRKANKVMGAFVVSGVALLLASMNVLPAARSAHWLELEFKRNPGIRYTDAVRGAKEDLDSAPFYTGGTAANAVFSKPGEYFGYAVGGVRHALGSED